jgi:hypothetical protein
MVHQDNLRHLGSTLEARPDHQGPPVAELVHGGQADVTDQPWQLKAELVHGGQADEHLMKLSPPTILTPVPAQKTPTRNSKKDLAYISRMTKTLARLESKYSIPVEKRKAAMFIRKPRTKHIIPKEFSAIFHLLCAPEPDPIIVPDPYPTVDWSTVRFKPALPNPESCPVFSASQDPTVYQEKASPWHPGQNYSTFTRENPFGTLPGYTTTHGIVAVPTTPVQGYIYCPDSKRWQLHASAATEDRGTAGGGRPGTRRGERGRRRK